MTAKVLFVDDEEANLVVCEATCRDRFGVLTASHADAALRWMREEEVGVIVADQRMPGISGVELLERVKQDFPDTVRVLITAYSDLPAAIDAINRGQVRRYLRKPWEPDELKAEIADALDVYELTRKLSILEQRLRETERVYALGVVAAGIAHELRNPIGWISNNLSHAQQELQRLEQALRGPEADLSVERTRALEVGEGLDDAQAGVQRILDIIQGIELPSRPPTPRQEVVDLGDVLRLTIRLVHGELRRCASLELDVQSSPKVRGSSTRVGQVALNLVVNALQALSEQPRAKSIISVRLKAHEGWAELEVADNGPGISSEDLERIFDPFFTTKPQSGTGLGLAISKKIAEDLGGRLEADNDPHTGGALFRLSLPALPTESD